MIDLPFIDRADPVRREHSLAAGLATWWLSLPGLDGGPRLWDLLGERHGALVQSSPASAWPSRKPRPGQLASAPALPAAVSALRGPDAPSAAANPYRAVANGGDYTFTHWVRLDARGATVGVLATVHDNAAGGAGLLSYAVPAADAWLVYVMATPFSLSGVLPADGAWRHLTVTRAAGTLRRYVNGQPVGAPSAATATGPARTDGLQVGNFAPGLAAYQFQGAADDVRFYTRALAPAEVLALYDDSRRGCLALLRRVPLRSRPPTVVPPLPVLPVRRLGMAAPGPRYLTARSPRPWDGAAAFVPVLDLDMTS